MRLHEAAKVLGTSAKALMLELEKQGIKLKTHMAVLDEKGLEALKKKYPDLISKAAAAPPPEDKAKKVKAPRTKSAKIVTQRTVTKKPVKTEEKVEEPTPAGTVEFVQRDEGKSGTVTLEQKTFAGGVLRRRRVEGTPPPAPVEKPLPEVSEEKPVMVKGLEEEKVVEPPVEKAVVSAAPVEGAKRNLSSSSRLRIVETPPQTPAAGDKKPVPTRPEERKAKPAKAAVAPEADLSSEATKEREALRKRPASKIEEVPQKLSKKDLLGLIEEVEVTRPFGRRVKKAHKAEKKQTQITTPGASKRKIRIENEITVSVLADRMGVKASDVIRKLMALGHLATIHQLLDHDTASLVASEYGYEVQNVAESAETLIKAEQAKEEDSVGAEVRAPIVTIMGHVDHGKTSLLDFIRKTRVVASEAGGITQHIGAYQVVHNQKWITFVDTPGHAAFTSMRARGASLTDIVILVVAADEGVKPQTLEALAHAQAAKVPIIVAINKMDKPEANPDRVIQELSKHNLVPESWGGDTIYCKISAFTGLGIPELLESILVQAEVLELKANPKRLARGVVVESRLDKGRGPVASVIVQTGTLSLGSTIVCGATFGKVRALFDYQGKTIEKAGPSTPVEILGFESVPNVGDTLTEVSEDAIARKVSELAQLEQRRVDLQKGQRLSLEEMYKKMQVGEITALRVILKGDVQGSVEAVADSLVKIKHEKVKVEVLYKAVGAITESDVDLATASGALIFGFNVRPTSQAKQLAQDQGVQIKAYEIIYELIDDVKKAMAGLLAPLTKETVLGQAEVREVFTVSKVGPVAGCFVKSGKILRNAQARLLRDNVVVYTAKIGSLRRFKDDAREVAEGFECGIRLDGFTDVKVGDIIECFENVEIQQAVG